MSSLLLKTGLKYVLSLFVPPIVQIDPGETVVIEVEDAASGQIRRKTDRRDRGRVPFGNPVVGPIYIKGAKRGSSISVSIIEIKPSIGQGTTYFSEFNEEYVAGTPILKFLGEKFPREPKICKIQNGRVYFSDELLLPYRPMIENKDEVMFVSTTRNGVSLENAIRTAFLELALWIEKKFALSRFDALQPDRQDKNRKSMDCGS